MPRGEGSYVTGRRSRQPADSVDEIDRIPCRRLQTRDLGTLPLDALL
jgi:hypothetical protein